MLFRSIIGFLFSIFCHSIYLWNLSLEEGNIIKNIRSIFRLKNDLNYTAIKDIRNLFRLKKKQTKVVKEY